MQRPMPGLWSGEYREPAYWAEMAHTLVSWADLRPGMNVLDVGSADGGTLFPALDRVGPYGYVTGIEIDEDWIAPLKTAFAERGVENSSSLLMDAERMTFPDASFDAAILGLVGLEGDYDFRSGKVLRGAPLLHEVSRVLKPGGRVYCSGWARQQDAEWMRELISGQLPGVSNLGFSAVTEDGFEQLLRAVGFEAASTCTQRRTYAFETAAEWMAGLRHVWDNELAEICTETDIRTAFEQAAAALLKQHISSEGLIDYERAAVFAVGTKPSC